MYNERVIQARRHRMKLTEIVVEGTLNPDGTLDLD
jgi:hypothetical protein